jgi:S1-C subfamily serine protease
MRALGIFLVFFLGAFWSGDTQGSRFFKWIGPDGVVHFSDRAPEESTVSGIQERVFQSSTGEMESESPPLGVPRNAIEYAIQSSFTIESSGSVGSGFFVSPDGYALTCKHVIHQGRNPVAVLNNNERFPIKVVSESPHHDLALLLVLTHRKMDPLPFRDANTLVAGDRILAIGTPMGLASTVTDGIFTGFRRIEANGDSLIQFSAPVNPGNSGGPLVDEHGKVVGVVTAKYLGDHEIPFSGIGFALPSSLVLESYGSYLHSQNP